MYPWPSYALATTRKPKNALEVVQVIMPLLFMHGGLGKALYDMVEKGCQNMTAVLCTGDEDHVSWETELGMAQVIAWCGARVADLERMFRKQFLFQLSADRSLTV